MYDGKWFDAAYFGHVPVQEHKSNYSRVGGYRDEIGDPVGVADFIDECVSGMSLDLLPKRGDDFTILEVGCANGALVAELRKRGYDALGIDASEYILKEAPQELDGYLMELDMRAIHTIEPDFNLIFSKDVLEHATEDEIDNILLQMDLKSDAQIHIVNTGQYEYQAAGGDQSHFLIKPLDWWEAKARELGIHAYFRET